ncbi:uncharacterized protein TEOVI_000619400 [Trypanosoma equiperdum]|uniref:Trypanosome variant surface glycoprotein (A-type) n=1 Tax=Trypanosoma equiperdum TaxID=5694 RepID=A0A1G4I2A3_TRYEQ|nr:hypothetical protein TEOVI_000619400 [Trypanosoma equiperdum]
MAAAFQTTAPKLRKAAGPVLLALSKQTEALNIFLKEASELTSTATKMLANLSGQQAALALFKDLKVKDLTTSQNDVDDATSGAANIQFEATTPKRTEELNIFLKEASELTTEATKMLANLSGQQTAIALFKDLKVKDSDVGQTDVDSAVNGAANIQFEATTPDKIKECHAKVHKKAAKFSSWATTAGFKTIKLFTTSINLNSAGTDSKPSLGKNSGRTCTHGVLRGGTTASSNICVIGGKITAETGTSIEATADNDFGVTALGAIKDDNQEHYNKLALLAAFKAIKKWEEKPQNFDINDANSYAADPDFTAEMLRRKVAQPSTGQPTMTSELAL